MKKLLAVLLAALLLAVPAFAQTASLAGEWTMTKTVASGVVMSPETYGVSMTLVLNPTVRVLPDKPSTVLLWKRTGRGRRTATRSRLPVRSLKRSRRSRSSRTARCWPWWTAWPCTLRRPQPRRRRRTRPAEGCCRTACCPPRAARLPPRAALRASGC